MLSRAMSSHYPPSQNTSERPKAQMEEPVDATLQEKPVPKPVSPSKSSLTALFTRIRANFPDSLSSETWYLVVASALISLSYPSCIADLYQHLASQSQYQDSEQRIQSSKKLRDLFLKTWTLVGIPPVISAVVALAEVEHERDGDERFEQ